MNKGNSLIRFVLKSFEDVFIKNENRQNGFWLGQCLIQSMIVMQSQVTAEPEEGYLTFCHSY